MPATRKCANCGKEFEPREEWHKYCSPRCQREADNKTGGDRDWADTRTNFRFDASYLKEGYFDAKKNLKPEILDSLALDVARALANTGINSHQLRRFFNQVRAAERGLSDQRPFETVRADLVELKSAAAYQVGRGLVREEFKRFIDRNVDLALQSEDNFRRGFIPHFSAVLGFFVYSTRER
jgi:CRISPR-associated protein Csm2